MSTDRCSMTCAALAARLEEAASEAAARFPARESADADEGEMLKPGAGAETELLGVAATDERSGGDVGGQAHANRMTGPGGLA